MGPEVGVLIKPHVVYDPDFGQGPEHLPVQELVPHGPVGPLAIAVLLRGRLTDDEPSRVLCRALSGGKTGFRARKCPVEVPLTGGAPGRNLASIALRWVPEKPPAHRPANGRRFRDAVSISVALSRAYPP